MGVSAQRIHLKNMNANMKNDNLLNFKNTNFLNKDLQFKDTYSKFSEKDSIESFTNQHIIESGTIQGLFTVIHKGNYNSIPRLTK